MLGTVAALSLAAPAAAEPAMWVVKDADSTIYLLGTFHMVKPGTQWRSHKIDAAFESSAELWLETTEGDDPTKIPALILKYGFDPKHPLSSKLSPEANVKLADAAKVAGMRPAALEPLRPWTAALMITVVPLVRAGYDPSKGVDKELEVDAKAARKTVKTFETPEEQILFFANLPEDIELEFLAQSLEEAALAPKMVDQMADAWVAGDIDRLDELVFDKMKQGAPELYDKLIVQRNRDWSERIAAMMAGAGTSFIAVGAGHLTGDHGVQALLAKRGLAVARY